MNRTMAFSVLLLAAALAGCGTQTTQAPVATPTAVSPVPTETPAAPTATPTLVVRGTIVPGQLAPRGTPAAAAAGNPFGLSIGPDSLSFERRVALAKTLGAAYFRIGDITADQWRGSCADCSTVERAGLKVAFTLRASGTATTPSKPPADAALFLRNATDIMAKIKPALVFVEHEDASFEFASYLGQPHEYAAELKEVCGAAHLQRLKCASGGIASAQIGPMLWEHYLEKYNAASACAFAQRVMDASTATVMCNARRLDQLPAKTQGDVNRGKAFLPLYRESGADYVSLNWAYSDAQALEEAVTYLRAAAKLPVVVKELRLKSDTSAAVAPLMQKTIDLGVTYAGWLSLDTAQSRALANADGSLRSSGKAFQEFVQSRLK